MPRKFRNPEERSRKLSEAHKKRGTKPPSRKGCKQPEESVKRGAEKRSGENNGNFGKHLSVGIRMKISEKLKGQKAWNKGF